MIGQPSSCGGVGAAKLRSNHERTAGLKGASASTVPGYRARPPAPDPVAERASADDGDPDVSPRAVPHPGWGDPRSRFQGTGPGRAALTRFATVLARDRDNSAADSPRALRRVSKGANASAAAHGRRLQQRAALGL